jgi:hypothetical protein
MSNHSFDIRVAEEYKSVELAILVWHFQYWIMKNKRLGRNFHDERTWTYQTYEEIVAVFPYWSRDQVKRILKKAIESEIIIRGNFNKNSFDQTIWYAFKDEEKFGISQLREMEETSERPSGIGRNRPIDWSVSPDGMDEIARCYKDTNTLPYTLPNKEREEAAPPARALSSSSKLIERMQHVSTTAEEHQKLIDQYGLEKVTAFYEILHFWKVDTPKSKWKKCDYRTILRWVVAAESERTIKKSPEAQKIDQEANKLIAMKIYNKFKDQQPRNVDIGNDYLLLINGPMNAEEIKFSDKSFMQKCQTQLAKRKINMENL